MVLTRVIAIVVFLASGVLINDDLTAQDASSPSSRPAFEVRTLRYHDVRELAPLLGKVQPVGPATARFFTNQNLNQLVIQGDPVAVEQAVKLIDRIDLPSSPAEVQTDRLVFESYDCTPDEMAGLLLKLRQSFSGTSDVVFGSDRAKNQIVVLATPAVHSSVARLIGTAVTTARDVGPNEIWRTIPIHHTDPDRMYRTLRALFGDRLNLHSIRNEEYLRVTLKNDGWLSFRIDTTRGMVQVGGPPRATEQFVALVQKLDADPNVARAVRAVSIQKSDNRQIEQAVDAFHGQDDKSDANDRQSQRNNSPFPVRQASHWQQQEPPNQQDETETEQLLRRLRDTVEVETLPDLDVIILRGRPSEVQELSRIIRELERLSSQTQPEIKVVTLQHARSGAVDEIIETVREDLVGGRQGHVSVTPLVKPNALLLIGWGDAVEVTTELIFRLDQPVRPETQFEVFRLRFAPATQIVTAIESFFDNRQGLGPEVRVIADTRSNSVVVYAAARDLDEVRLMVGRLDVSSSSTTHRARIFQIENALATELATTLQTAIQAARGSDTDRSSILELLSFDPQGKQLLHSAVLDDVEVTPNALNNTLIVTGPSESMDLIAALIERMDTAGAVAQIKVFRILHGDAASLVQMLRSLVPEQSGPDAPLKLPYEEGEPSFAPLRFSVDTRTNSIIATGSESDLRIIYALLTRLDEKEFSQRRNMVYRLKNSPAIDVAQAINDFLRSERQVQLAAGGSASPFEQIEREVVVVPEPVSNKLILSATPRYFEEIERLIEKLDEPPPQVLIQVLIAEVALNDAEEFGAELGFQDSVLFDRSLLGDLQTTLRSQQLSTAQGVVVSTQEIIQAATNTPGFNFVGPILGNSGSDQSLATASAIGGQGISSFGVGRINDELGFGGLVFSANSANVSLLIRALKEFRRVDILSRPQVRTLDNQPAFIQVGQRVPRIIGSTVNQAGQSNNITLENVGLILGVTPRISPDGTVVMEIDSERSRVGPEQEGIPVSVSVDGTVIRSPRVDTITAQATVSAASGETIILGGLITKEKTKFSRRVPGLSDVPLLGGLFRYDGYQVRRTELLIILTPHVIRGPEDEHRLRQQEMARMNWCACDVYDLHGPVDESFAFEEYFLDQPPEQVIYPDNAVPQDEPSSRRRQWDEPEPRELPPPAGQFEPPQQPDPGARDGVGGRHPNQTQFEPPQVAQAEWSGIALPQNQLRRLDSNQTAIQAKIIRSTDNERGTDGSASVPWKSQTDSNLQPGRR